MKHEAIRRRFEEFLSSQQQKMTTQRARIFERAFATHEHFSAEQLYEWLRDEDGPRVSRATVYRTLNLLEQGGFVESLDVGRGEVVYEHVLGHPHHDHLICVECGRIVEFTQPQIERLQEEVARSKGFELVDHSLRLMGVCAACRRKSGASAEEPAGDAADEAPERARGSSAG